MSNMNAIVGADYEWRAKDITLTRSIPSNDTDIASMVNTLKDIVSEETLLAQIPFVNDVSSELQKIKAEREENKELNPFFQTIFKYLTIAMENSEERE